MTDRATDTAPSVRLLTDGGVDEPTTVTKTRRAKDVVTREVDGDEQEMLRVPISSTRVDREDDRFDKAALEGMAEAIRSEQPMVFDNHGLAGSWMDAIPYDSRETIGAQMDAELESAEDGEWDLYALVNPDGTHPEGERLLAQVSDEGQPVKFSVGFAIKGFDSRAEVEGDYEGDGRIFTAVDLMETSRVGIPANPDASVTQSATAKGLANLPGYRNHPFMRMLMAADEAAGGATAAKDAVDADTVEDATPVRTDGQGETTTRDADPDGKGPCDDNGDCPDGEVCVDGECVPEDEVDDDDSAGADDACPECDADTPEGASYCPDCGESLSADADATRDGSDEPQFVKDAREERRELREEIRALREAGLDRGDAKTGDTDMTDTTAEPDAGDDADEPDEPRTAMDEARR